MLQRCQSLWARNHRCGYTHNIDNGGGGWLGCSSPPSRDLQITQLPKQPPHPSTADMHTNRSIALLNRPHPPTEIFIRWNLARFSHQMITLLAIPKIRRMHSEALPAVYCAPPTDVHHRHCTIVGSSCFKTRRPQIPPWPAKNAHEESSYSTESSF